MNSNGKLKKSLKNGEEIVVETKDDEMVYLASKYNCPKSLLKLIELKSDINTKNCDFFIFFFSKIVFFLSYDLDLTDSGKSGSTPLHVACWGSNYECVKILLENGADKKMLNNYGESCLHNAKNSPKGMNQKIVEMLENEEIEKKQEFKIQKNPNFELTKKNVLSLKIKQSNSSNQIEKVYLKENYTKETKVVIISDTHVTWNSDKLKVPDGDILIHCGDYSKKGKESEVTGFVEFMNKQPHKHKIVVSGIFYFLYFIYFSFILFLILFFILFFIFLFFIYFVFEKRKS